jgi:hypothetical protein
MDWNIMRLGKGHNMQRWWKRPVFPVAAMTVAWLVGMAFAVGRTQISAKAASPSYTYSIDTSAQTPVLLVNGQRYPAQAAGQAAAPSDRPLMVEDVFKNVQALTKMPVADFMLTMGIMTSSLGFDCSDCHDLAGTDKVNWAADTPRKRTARRMVTMVQAINREHFNNRQVVTCFSCHRNRDRPLTTPTMDMMYGEPKVEPDDFLPATPGTPSADQVFDKYIAALGGAQRLNSLTSYVATGSSTGFGGFGGNSVVTIYAKAPDMRSTIVTWPNIPGRDINARTFNGRTGWIQNPLSVLGEYQLAGTEIDGARLDAQLGFPGQIKTVLSNWRVSEPFEHVRDREVYAVQGDGPRGTFATFYFDKETGLLIRSIRYGATAIGKTPTQIDFDNYKDMGGGIKFPSDWVFKWPGGLDNIKLSDIKTNVPIDASRFERPSVAKQ